MQPSIRVAEPELDGNESRYVLDCIESSWISSRGKYIARFEGLVAKFCGVKYAVATNNGTAALHLALASHGIGPGDEVILPTLTYIASVNAIRYCGATPVLVDSQMPHLTLDPADVEAKVTPRTRGIVTVPLYGHPVEFERIEKVAKKHQLCIIEDAAEALGAKYAGQPVGSLADCATFSFFGNKIITTGEGGMVVTNNDELARRLIHLRGQAVSPTRQYWHTDVGFNYRMTNVAAAIGCAQMERITTHLQRRQSVARWYVKHLAEYDSLLILPSAAAWAHHCYWMFTVLIKDGVHVHRDDVIEQLAKRGVETRPVFHPVHQMPPYQQPGGVYPIAEKYAARGVCLPTHGRLNEQQVEYVCRQLKDVIDPRRSQTVPSRRAAA